MQTSSIFTNSEITDSKNAENAAKSAMEKLQDDMYGAAGEAGLNFDDDVIDMLSEMRKEELYAKLKRGLEDIEKGNTRPLSEAFDEIEEMLEKRREIYERKVQK